MTSIHPPEPGITGAVRAGAAGLYSLEAACELIIGTGWLRRDDFALFISTGTSLTNGVTELAHIDWQVCTVIENEHEGDVQDEHVEPDIPGVYPAVRGHGGGVLLTVSRRAALAAASWSW